MSNDSLPSPGLTSPLLSETENSHKTPFQLALIVLAESDSTYANNDNNQNCLVTLNAN